MVQKASPCMIIYSCLTETSPNAASLRNVKLRNLSNIDLDVSKLRKVKSDGTVGLTHYDFLLVFNSNTCRN